MNIGFTFKSISVALIDLPRLHRQILWILYYFHRYSEKKRTFNLGTIKLKEHGGVGHNPPTPTKKHNSPTLNGRSLMMFFELHCIAVLQTRKIQTYEIRYTRKLPLGSDFFWIFKSILPRSWENSMGKTSYSSESVVNRIKRSAHYRKPMM